MYLIVKARLKELNGLSSNEEGIFVVSRVRLVSLFEEVERGERMLDLDGAEILLETQSRNEALQYADQKASVLYGGVGGEL